MLVWALKCGTFDPQSTEKPVFISIYPADSKVAEQRGERKVLARLGIRG